MPVFDTFPPETLYAYPIPPPLTERAAAKAFDRFDPLRVSEAPLAIYVHVPYCVSICNFCGFVKTNRFSRDTLAWFSRAVMAELDILIQQLDLDGTSVEAVFFGGGTASILDPIQVASILNGLRRRLRIADDAELTFEGECMTLRRDGYLEELHELGIRRLSFGVQVMDAGLRALLNLRPGRDQLQNLIERARPLFDDVAIDYIYGWPMQTPDTLEGDLRDMITTLAPPTIEVFQFEKLDASPAFLRRLYAAGARDPHIHELQRLRRRLLAVLADYGYGRAGYTKFTKAAYAAPVSYGSCYYGWDEGQVVGIGRGAQSFFGGATWGSALSEGRYAALLEAGKPPVRDFGRYRRGEREQVTWPRRGWVEKTRLSSGAWQKVQDLARNDLCRIENDRTFLTEIGDLWVPAILQYMMPARQAATVALVSDFRLKNRRPVIDQEVLS